jgi:hypothetical protein
MVKQATRRSKTGHQLVLRKFERGRLGFRWAPTPRIRYLSRVGGIAENSRLFQCFGSLGARRHRAGLAEGHLRLGVQVEIMVRVFLIFRHQPELDHCNA